MNKNSSGFLTAIGLFLLTIALFETSGLAQETVTVTLPQELSEQGVLSSFEIARQLDERWKNESLRKLWPEDSLPIQIQLTRDSDQLVFVGNTGRIRLFGRQEDANEFRLQADESVKQFEFMPDGRASVVDADEQLLIWTFEDGIAKKEPISLGDNAKALALADNGLFVAGVQDGRTFIYDLDKRSEPTFLQDEVPAITSMRFSPSRRLLVGAHSDELNRLAVWQLPENKIVREFKIEEKIKRIISVSSNDDSIAIETTDKRLCVYLINKTTQRKIYDIEIPEGGSYFVSGDHKRVGAIDAAGELIERVTVETRVDLRDKFYTVPVYFGTNRRIVESSSSRPFIEFFKTGFGLVTSFLILAIVLTVSFFLHNWCWRFTTITAGALVLLMMALAQFVVHNNQLDIAPGQQFSAEHESGPLNLGVCQVTIPDNHVVGELESPFELWIFRMEGDPESHVLLNSVITFSGDSEFKEAVNQHVHKLSNKQAFLFIHGFNVSFRDAVRRTAQLQVDLKIEGPALCYSWPSHGDFVRYPADEANAQLSREKLCEFIELVMNETNVESLNIIAHSMGNRVLGEAFRQLPLPGDENKSINNVILAAPDIDQRTFIEQIAPEISLRCRQVTLYASSNDNALELSQNLHAYQRAGDTTPEITICDGIYTIDASEIDTSILGHSYYGDKAWILEDIFSILNGNGLPDKRFGLQRIGSPAGRYWKFRKGVN